MNEQNKDTVTLPRDLWEKARAILKYVTENGLPEQPEPEAEEPRKPTLDDYTTIKTYEDACEALGENPITGVVVSKINGVYKQAPRHIFALMKLETISRALWGREWKPGNSENYYLPIFFQEKGGVLTYGDCRYCAMPDGQTWLFQETAEKAEYFGRQFLPLWAEYLGFDTEKREDER